MTVSPAKIVTEDSPTAAKTSPHTKCVANFERAEELVAHILANHVEIYTILGGITAVTSRIKTK